MTDQDRLAGLSTPSLVLDESRMMRNIERMRRHIDSLGVMLRPHLKTSKSIDVASRLLTHGNGPATVSTLREAEVFAAAGVRDIFYAVGISPDKLQRVSALRKNGCDVSITLDSEAQAKAVVEASRMFGEPIPALIEIDCDGHRSGLTPRDPAIVAIGRILHEGGACPRGVMTHAGASYGENNATALVAFAEKERAAAVTAAEALRKVDLPCPVVSVGSTPTAHFARNLDGVTEVRAGVFVFFDLVMAGIGVCTTDAIALSVLSTVIGHRKDRNMILIDAGWMALSRDRGTQTQAIDRRYGLVCDVAGNVIEDLIVADLNQEHGMLGMMPNSSAQLPNLAVGTRLRILPNHACATAAQFDEYAVLPIEHGAPIARWQRFRGW